MASWYRARTRVDHGEASRRVNAAARLPNLPLLAETFAAGDLSQGHVTAVTEAAVPQRAAAIAGCEQPLVALALAVRPYEVRRAVGRIRDLADPDGADDPAPLPTCGPDPRRYLDVHPTIDGLVEGRFLLDQLAGEALLTALDAAETPDPPETPVDQRRCPKQRRADALARLVHAALDAGTLPSVQGSRPQVLLTVDLATLLGHDGQDGQDGQATRAPRLRFTGDLDAHRARHLALRAAITVVLTMGPWRVVNVGRRFRTLPPWLRSILEVVHASGEPARLHSAPLRFAGNEAHHAQQSWLDGGDTDVNATVPLCQAHHDLVTVGGWTVRFDPDTGACTWTDTAGTTLHTQAAAA